MHRPGDWYQKQRRATSLVGDDDGGGDGSGDGGGCMGGGDGGDGDSGGGDADGSGDGGSAAAGDGPRPEPRCLAGCSGVDCRCAELSALAFSVLPTWAA